MNIQDECQNIHSQFGTSEMANYKIQLLCDKYAKESRIDGIERAIELIQKARGMNGAYGSDALLQDAIIALLPIKK